MTNNIKLFFFSFVISSCFILKQMVREGREDWNFFAQWEKKKSKLFGSR